MTTFRMKPYLIPFALTLALGVASCGSGDEAEAEKAGPAKAGAEKAGEEASHAEDAGERVTISPEAAKASGVGVKTAGPGAIQETLELTGRIVLQPSARADIHAPYPGPVRAVLRNVGDNVRRGETLARIESAESLQTYAVSAPIAGVVLERQTNVGDVTSGDPLFVVGDLSRLQAELNVVTRDIGRVAGGQDVIITGLDGTTKTEARIAAVLPTADSHSQTLIARAPIAPKDAAAMRPGMAVRAAVVLSELQAPIVVAADAVQSYEGKSVVFVRVSADTYEARPVTVGRAGRNTVEITSGLSAGESYVSENAFLVKAEIGKGAASHDD
ncbi:MAG: efflux RND transporter periplasmic adaptor subunit [Hyphomonadaceae bacterium]|nr:efflux RND transporter periplasmic adaptor subunit [Hyphomonadaceae bacterium]